MRLMFLAALAFITGCFPLIQGGGGVECTVDADCFEGGLCNTITGLCEFLGEGEGEPEPEPLPPQCSLEGFAEPNGDGFLFIGSAFLDVDFDNVVECTVGSSYLASFIGDRPITADFSGNEVRFSADGGPPEACSGRLAADGTFVVCPICFVTAPQELAIQLEGDDGVLSNATCVDTSGV